MHVNTDTLIEVLRELEAVDPIDYADLPFGEQELRKLVIDSLVDRHQGLLGTMCADDVHATYLLTTAKLVLENVVLHARLLMLQGSRVDVQALLAPFTLKGQPKA
jgi:hypothetical protein